MRARARWLFLGLGAAGVYGCGTLLDIQPDPAVDASEAGDATTSPTSEGGADASLDAPDETSTCVAKSCADLGANCGAAPDECGQTIADCGVCTGRDTCGAAGPNRCGDGGCDAATSCSPGQCGAVSNGCGGTIECGVCKGGHRHCNAGTCHDCPLLSPTCARTSSSQCPGSPPATSGLYSCPQAATIPGCVYCPNPTMGGGQQYCCP